MLGKLIKYDFKSLGKSLIPIFGITMLLSLLARITNYLGTKISIIQYPAGFITGLAILLIIGTPFIAFIISISKYYKNMIKDEGYLTHTLPVSKNNLVLSKLITSSIMVLLAIIVSIGSVFIGFNVYSDVLELVRKLYDVVMDYNEWILLLVVISLVVSYISNVLLMYASISLGQTHSGNKLVYSVVYGIVLYNITQIVTTILLMIPYLFDKNYLTYLEQEVPDPNFINNILIFGIILTVIVSIVYYIMSTKILEKRLNLE